MGGDPGDLYLSAREMYEEQHIIGHQSPQREDLHREEVGPREDREVSSNECRPRGRVPSLWRGRYAVTTQDIADSLILDLMP